MRLQNCRYIFQTLYEGHKDYNFGLFQLYIFRHLNTSKELDFLITLIMVHKLKRTYYALLKSLDISFEVY